MKVLIVHQNAPGQYRHIIGRMAADPANEVVVLSQSEHGRMPGVRWVVYPTPDVSGVRPHRYLGGVEVAVHTAEAVMHQALDLKRQGFTPDIMLGHNAWGETLFLKDVWPDVPLMAYFEFFYHARGADVGFDRGQPGTFEDFPRLRTRNAINLMGLDAADWGQSPTRWQRAQYPSIHRSRISVFHDGVDTRLVCPNPNRQIGMGEGLPVLRVGDEIVTYVARNLEPYRGFHIFMQAVPEILRRRPNARVVIVGGDDVSYGVRRSDGRSHRDALLQEIAGRVDLSRVHLLGALPYDQYRAILQVSAVHVYLTYPFVLSWSMLEAMASGCVVLGSATPPVEEIIRDGDNGLLTDFFDADAIARRIDEVLSHPDRMAEVRRRARETIVRDYDRDTVCLPRFLATVDDLIAGRVPALDPVNRDPAPAPAATPSGRMTTADAMAFGAAATQAGNLDGAIHIYASIVRQRPDHVDALYELALVYYRQRRVAPALALMQRALALDPARANLIADYGVISGMVRRREVRLSCYRRALVLAPENPSIHMNLGAALYDLGEIEQAEACCLRALELRPGQYGALTNLGNAQFKLGKLDQAVGTYREALAINPQSPEIRKNLGMILFLKGDLPEGARLYEDRLQTIEAEDRPYTQPRWNGEPLAGRTLFLHAEQGMGDTLHFCRYVPLIKARGAGRVLIEAQPPLVSLLRTLDGCDGVVPKGAAPPDFDVHCPLLSLIHACGTTLDTIPAGVPYLSADPQAIAAWGRRLPSTGRLRVGIVWGGSALHMNDHHRSMPLRLLRPLLDLPGVEAVSLQVGPPREQIAAEGLTGRLPDLGAQVGDFADTAALLHHIDVVVSVDTSIVHLAGAIGRPCWVLVPFSPDWRWLVDRADSPWYPSLRLFRQGSDGAWPPVVDAVSRALEGLAQTVRQPVVA